MGKYPELNPVPEPARLPRGWNIVCTGLSIVFGLLSAAISVTFLVMLADNLVPVTNSWTTAAPFLALLTAFGCSPTEHQRWRWGPWLSVAPRSLLILLSIHLELKMILLHAAT